MSNGAYYPEKFVTRLTEAQQQIHAANVAKGWWKDGKTTSMQACLFTSESSEALEGYRKNLPDDKLPEYPMIAVELVDIIIRGLDHAGYINLEWTLHDCRSPVRVNEQVLDNLARINWHIAQWWYESRFFNEMDKGEYHLKQMICLSYFTGIHLGFPMDDILEKKLAFNAVRPDHVYEERTNGETGSKKF